MWHKIANQLVEHYTVVASDLGGYRHSSKPETDVNHSPYSKRASANDQVQLMNQLGFNTFMLIGHDRGGRVGHMFASTVIFKWEFGLFQKKHSGF